MGGNVKGKQSRWDWRIRVGNGENMFCKNCGKEIKEGDAFCGRCGTPVLTQTKEPKGSSAGVAKQKKKLVTPVIVVILAIVAVGTGGTLFVNSDRYQSRKNMKLAEEMYRSEEYEEAISYYEEALKLDNSIARAYAGEADIHVQRGNYDQALETAEGGLAHVREEDKKLLMQKFVEIYEKKAQALFADEEYGKTVELLREGEEKTGERSLGFYAAELFQEKSDAYLSDNACIQAIEILMLGIEYTGSNELAKREAYVRENTVIAGKSVTDYDSTGEVAWHYYECEYDENGNEIKYIPYVSYGQAVGGYMEYEYDEGGNRIREIDYDANGKVSLWAEYEYDENGNQIKYIIYDADGEILWNSEWEYDESGNQIKIPIMDRSGKIPTGYRKIEYDEKGNAIKEIGGDYADNGDENVDYKSESEYDENGNQIKYIEYNSAGEVSRQEEYGYDENGNRIKYIEYNSAGEVSKRKEYDKNGNAIKIVEYDNDGRMSIYGDYEYEYDANGKIIQRITYDFAGTRREYEEHSYDGNGKEIKRLSAQYDVDGEKTDYQENVYEYDEIGNLIRRTEDGICLYSAEYTYAFVGDR